MIIRRCCGTGHGDSLATVWRRHGDSVAKKSPLKTLGSFHVLPLNGFALQVVHQLILSSLLFGDFIEKRVSAVERNCVGDHKDDAKDDEYGGLNWDCPRADGLVPDTVISAIATPFFCFVL